jgi:hypothetical protein
MQTNLSGKVEVPHDGGAQIVNEVRKSLAGPGPEIMDAKTLSGDAVVNAAGDRLGNIEAIMLDVASGRIAYAVLSFGGFLGMGTKLFALPWGALTLDAGEKRFIFDVSREKLENAEGFDKEHWPSMADPVWATRIHDYYNVAPYWQRESADADPRSSAGLSAGRAPLGRTTTY